LWYADDAILTNWRKEFVKLEDKIEFENGGEINNLDNSKKINTFTKNSNNGSEQEIHDRGLHNQRMEEARPVEKTTESSITEKALELRRRIQEAQLDAEKRASLHVDINRIIYDYCVAENIWFDNTIIASPIPERTYPITPI
jgi:hypothetical protein